MKITQTIRALTAITIAIALGLLVLIPADASSEEVTVMRHTTQPLRGYGTAPARREGESGSQDQKQTRPGRGESAGNAAK